RSTRGSSHTGPGPPLSPPSGDQGDKSRMNREVHVRICGSRRVRLPPATRPADQAGPGTSGAGHRQAAKLSGGASGGDAVGRAPAVEIPEPRGELSPADPAPRTRHETL